MMFTTVKHRWLLALALASSCSSKDRGLEVDVSSHALISDGAHRGGTPGFYFLPPLVPPPAFSGVHVATLSPVVEILSLDASGAPAAVIATYTTSSGPGDIIRSQPQHQHYVVHWDTKRFTLSAAVTYRIRVLLDGRELGFADVDLVRYNFELSGVDASQYVGLVDGLKLSIRFRIETSAAHSNRPPAILSTGPTTATENQLYVYFPIAVDPDGDEVTLELEEGPPGLVLFSASGVIAWTPADLQTGPSRFRIRATDPAGLSTTETVELVVAGTNDPPAIISTPAGSIVEGTQFFYDVEAIDRDPAELLTYAIDSAPSEMSIDASSGELSWTPDDGDIGLHTIRVRVEDLAGASAEQTFTLSVIDENEPPVIVSAPITETDERVAYAYRVEIEDPDRFDAHAFDLIAAPEGMTIDPFEGDIRWNAMSPGIYAVALRVTDLAGLTAVQEFGLVVNDVNDPPRIMTPAPASGAALGASFMHDVDALDADGEALRYDLVRAPSGAVIDAAAGLIFWTPRTLEPALFEVRAADPRGLEDTQTFEISVDAPPSPPPVARFSTARGLNVIQADDGGRVTAVSEGTLAQARTVIDDNVGGLTASTIETPLSMRVAFIDDRLEVVDRAVVEAFNAGIDRFEIWVSTSSSADASLVRAFAGTYDPNQLEVRFEPVLARQAELRILSPGASGFAGVRRFELRNRPRQGGIVSLLEGGATIALASWPLQAPGAIAHECTGGYYGAAPDSFVIELSPREPIRIDHLELSGIRFLDHFELRTSTAGPDLEMFSLALSSRYEHLGEPELAAYRRNYVLEDARARFADLRALSALPGYAVPFVPCIRIFSPQLGGLDVGFDNLTRAGDAGLTYSWDFGDGSSSTERHPYHHYVDAGEYEIRLEVSDAFGRTSSATMRYTAYRPPEADFTYTPFPLLEAGQPTFTSVPRTFGADILGYAFRTDYESQMYFTPLDYRSFGYWGPGRHIDHQVLDTRLLTSEIESREIPWVNTFSTATATIARDYYWGELMRLDIDFAEPYLGGTLDADTLWDFGDGTILPVSRSSGPDRQFHRYEYPGNYLARLDIEDIIYGGHSSTYFTIRVHRRPTSLASAGHTDTPGGVVLRAMVIDDFDGGGRRAGLLVDFSTGATALSAVTDADGVAEVTLPPGTTGFVTASFAGNSDYLGSREVIDLDAVPLVSQNSGNEGREFVLAFPHFYSELRASGMAPPELALQQVYRFQLTGRQNTIVRLENDLLGVFHVAVRPGIVSSFTLPGDFVQQMQQRAFDVRFNTFLPPRIEGAKFRLSADAPFSVTQLRGDRHTMDSALAIPVNALGTDYVVPSAYAFSILRTVHDSMNARLAILSAGEDAAVEVIPPVPFSVDSPSSALLSATGGESLEYHVRDLVTLFEQDWTTIVHQGDPTGTRVTSDAPVSVYASHACALVPFLVFSCNSLLEHVPPTRTLGRRYHATSFGGRRSGAIARVVAVSDGTVVRVNGTITATLTAQTYWERRYAQSEALEIETSAPALAYQLALGVDTEPNPEPNPEAETANGDPTMILLVPAEQWSSRYTVQTFDGFPAIGFGTTASSFESWATLVVPTDRVSGMIVDQQPVLAFWTPIGDGAISFAHIPLAPGAHNIYHADPTVRFGAYLYGWAPADAYGHPAGTQLAGLYGSCSPSPAAPGDRLDNDCDAAVDEEAPDGADDDGDGAIDEDLAPGPIPSGHAPIAYELARQIERDTPSGGVVLPAFDADGDILTYEIVTVPAHGRLGRFEPVAAIVDAPAIADLTNVGPIVRYVPDPGFTGADAFEFRVFDGSDFSFAAQVTLDVVTRNRAPVITSFAPRFIGDGEVYAHDAEAADPDPGTVITFSLDRAPPGMSIDPLEGLVTWPTDDADIGRHFVTVVARDSAGAADSESFMLEVLNTPEPPVITSTPAAAALAGSLYAYQPSFTDPDPSEVHRSSISAPAGAVVDASTGRIEWRPEPSQLGAYAFEVSVRDQDGLTDMQSWTVSVRPTNRAPGITSAPLTTAAAFGEYRYQAVAADPDLVFGDAIDFTRVSGPAGLTVSAAGLVVWTPTAEDLGAHEVILRAMDSGGLSALQSYRLLVVSANHPPRFVSSPITWWTVDQPYAYAIAVADPDLGDVPQLALQVAPPGMTLSGATLSWTPSSGDAGTHAVSVRATDREGATVTHAFALAIEETNFAPSIVSPPVTLAVQGQAYRYQVVVFDENARDGRSFELLAAPSGMTVAAGGLIEWTPSASQIGAQGVHVRARDFGGLTAEQSFSVTVADVNDAPVFTSLPVTTAIEDAAYVYAAAASDPDLGDSVRFALASAPRGMSVASGRVSWIPATDQVGSHLVRLQAFDDHGASAWQSFTITVSNTNDPPRWSSTPDLEVPAAGLYTYALYAFDPDEGDVVSYALIAPPAGMTLDAARSVITWRAPLSGSVPVVIEAIDLQGTSARQSFTVSVVEDHDNPRVTIAVSPSSIDPGESALVTVTAEDQAQLVAVELTLDEAPIALDAEGRAIVTPTTPGIHVLRASAIDASGNEGIALAQLGVTDPSDSTAPVVDIVSPREDATVLMQVPVTGTVDDANLVEWSLTLAPVNGGEPRMLATGTSSVAHGTIDGTLLENGWWRLRLQATDVNGASSTDEVIVEVQGEAKVGVLRLAFIDLQLPVSGIPITVTRVYDSRSKSRGDFGVGWRLDIKTGTIEHNRTPGIGWSIHENFPPPSFPCSVVDELESHYTTVRLSDSEWYTFRPTLVNVASSLGSCYADVAYELFDGTVPNATLAILGNTTVVHLSGTDEVVDERTMLPFEPAAVRLETPDGRRVTIQRGAGITAIGDLAGNTLSIASGGITHSSGRSVRFTRDALDRITRITDPLGNEVSYAYDDAGDLISVEDQLGQTTRFEYSPAIPHHLDRVIGPDGRERATFEYDAEMRLHESCNAESACTMFDYDLAARTETLTDATGRTLIVSFDERGRILAHTDAFARRTRYEYDPDGNMTAEIDPLGGRTSYAYDSSGNLISRTDPAQRTEEYRYDARGRLTWMRTEGGGVYELDRDALGRITAFRNDQGSFLRRTYDALGNVVEEDDRSYTFDQFGNAITSRDAGGALFQMTYDAAGQLSTMTGDRGESWSFAHDALGRETIADYGDGLVVSYGYDSGPSWTTLSSPTTGTLERRLTPMGHLAGWTLQDGGRVTYVHDAAGRLLEEHDPLGNVTRYSYDAAGQRTARTAPNGAVTTFARDALGRAVEVRDSGGALTTSSYAADGSLSSMTDPLGRTVRFTQSPTVAVTIDALGRTTRVERNRYGLAERWIHADGTITRAAYDGASELEDPQPTMIVDEAGRARIFDYDALERLTSATDLAGNVFSYSYGRDGLTSITNPIGETVALTLDRHGRTVGVTYPDGNTHEVTFGLDGKPAVSRSPDGTTTSYAYDAAQRLTRRQARGENAVLFTWNSNDGLTEMQDQLGIERFAYDSMSNLVEVEQPSGARIRYERDLEGRITRVAVRPNAGAAESITDYEYDLLGNLSRVIDPSGGATAISYDAANRRVTRVLPNGVTTAWTYDLRDRIASVTHRRGDGSILASFVYERGATGEPTRVVREDGSQLRLEYDAALRLAGERYLSAAGAVLEEIAYLYDAAGNRVARAGSGGVETYSYAAGGQLASVTSASGVATYAHDAGGRLVSIGRDGETRTLAYSASDALTRVSGGSAGTIDFAANGLGHRAIAGRRRWVSAPVDPDGLAMLHAVIDESGTVLATYSHAGGRPFMRAGAGGPGYYLEDGLGSVIAVVDSSGGVAGRAEYDGFGNLRSAPATNAAGGEFGFHGAWLEQATGFYHFHAREYDPRTGRFLSRDPADPNPSMPESLHPYAFAASNPFLYADANGREFSIIGLNMSMSVQDILQGVQRFAIGEVKDYAVDKIKGLGGILIQRFLESAGAGGSGIFGALQQAYYGHRSLRQSGNELEGKLKHLFCRKVLGDRFQELLYFEVSMDKYGKPTSPGFNCKRGSEQIVGGSSRPDLLFSEWHPQSLGRRGPKSMLIGEIKLQVSTLLNAYVHGGNPRQFETIIAHAQNYEYAPVVAFLTLVNSPGTLPDIEKLAAKMFHEGVAGVIVTLH